MGENLSQKEIDDLFKMMAGGDSLDVEETPQIAKKEIKVYDFSRPSKFNKEQLRALSNIFDNYSRNLSSFLTGYLRTSTHIEVISAEQVNYNEFSNILINPVILAILEMHPLKSSVVLELSANIGYCIIDRILGGPGYAMKKLRDFSEIEKILLERVITQMLNFLPEAWENVAKIRPRIEKIETNSQFAQIIAPTDITVLITLSIKVGGVEGLINFCIPYVTMQSVMDRLNTRNWYTVQEQTDTNKYSEYIENKINQANIPVTAVVGRTRISVDDFVHMQVGDIIPLDSYINSDLQIMVGNLLKFYAKPGISKGKNAVQITSVIQKEE